MYTRIGDAFTKAKEAGDIPRDVPLKGGPWFHSLTEAGEATYVNSVFILLENYSTNKRITNLFMSQKSTKIKKNKKKSLVRTQGYLIGFKKKGRRGVVIK